MEKIRFVHIEEKVVSFFLISCLKTSSSQKSVVSKINGYCKKTEQHAFRLSQILFEVQLHEAKNQKVIA